MEYVTTHLRELDKAPRGNNLQYILKCPCIPFFGNQELHNEIMLGGNGGCSKVMYERSSYKKSTHYYQKNSQQEGNPMTPLNLLKIPLPSKLKESAQSPELKTSKQMRTLRQMKFLAYIISYSQAQLPLAQTQYNR